MKNSIKKINKNNDVSDHPYFHDTWKLLKHYRDVVWSLESSVQQLRINFQMEFGTSIDEFLSSINNTAADLSDSNIKYHTKCIERSRKMLQILESGIDLMRTKHKRGEEYYWVLYYTFLSPQQLENVDEIIEKLLPHIRNNSYRTYYRKRRAAIETLSSMLWGYTSRDCMAIISKFIPDEW